MDEQSTDERQWRALQDSWQSTDLLGEARDRWRRKQRRDRWSRGLEYLGCAGGIALALYFGLAHPRPVTLVLTIFVGVFISGSLVFTIWTRRTLARSAPSDTRTFVTALRHRHGVEWRLNRLGRYSVWIVGVFCALWMPWQIWVNRLAYAAEPWRAIVGVGGVIVILGGVLWSMRRERRRLEEEGEWLARLERDLAEPGPEATES